MRPEPPMHVDYHNLELARQMLDRQANDHLPGVKNFRDKPSSGMSWSLHRAGGPDCFQRAQENG